MRPPSCQEGEASEPLVVTEAAALPEALPEASVAGGRRPRRAALAAASLLLASGLLLLASGALRGRQAMLRSRGGEAVGQSQFLPWAPLWSSFGAEARPREQESYDDSAYGLHYDRSSYHRERPPPHHQAHEHWRQAPAPALRSGWHTHGELFCFAVMLSASREQALLERAASLRAGIFDCDDQVVFSDTPTRVGGLTSVGLGSLRSHLGGALTTSWVNSDSFILVWRSLRDSRRFVGFTWTVKVDPDTVFVPSALRPRLRGHQTGPVYFRNCPNVDDGFYGAIEVVSQAGVQAYVNNLEKCRHTLPYHNGWGEDLFAQKCMDQAGVHSDADYSMVADKNCPTGLHLNGCAPGYPAYHHYKDPAAWTRCWHQARSSSRLQLPRPQQPRHEAGPGFGAPRFEDRSAASSHPHYEDQYASQRYPQRDWREDNYRRYEDEYEPRKK